MELPDRTVRQRINILLKTFYNDLLLTLKATFMKQCSYNLYLFFIYVQQNQHTAFRINSNRAINTFESSVKMTQQP